MIQYIRVFLRCEPSVGNTAIAKSVNSPTPQKCCVTANDGRLNLKNTLYSSDLLYCLFAMAAVIGRMLKGGQRCSETVSKLVRFMIMSCEYGNCGHKQFGKNNVDGLGCIFCTVAVTSRYCPDHHCTRRGLFSKCRHVAACPVKLLGCCNAAWHTCSRPYLDGYLVLVRCQAFGIISIAFVQMGAIIRSVLVTCDETRNSGFPLHFPVTVTAPQCWNVDLHCKNIMNSTYNWTHQEKRGTYSRWLLSARLGLGGVAHLIACIVSSFTRAIYTTRM